MTKIFNPLDQLDTPEPRVLESTSSLVNDTVGVCPKCKQPFGTAAVGSDTVYYCERCRVSHPIAR